MIRMSRRLIVLLTFVLAFQVSVKAQEKWNLKVNAGTNYAIPAGIFSTSNAEMPYRNNKDWYPGFTLGTNMSYNVLPWLAVESGLNFERIRTGYHAYHSDATNPGTGYGSGGTYDPGTYYLVKEHYSKNYLNVPLYIALRTSPNFGFFGGTGYRICLSKDNGWNEKWNELYYTGGFFMNFGRIDSRVSYTEGAKDKTWVYFSKSRTISISVGYTLWKK